MARPANQTSSLIQGQGRFTIHEVLLDAVTTTSAGQWIDTWGVHPFSVTFRGPFSAQCKVRVSNGGAPAIRPDGQVVPTKPTDSDSGHGQLGSTVTTADGTIVSDGPYRYLKIEVSAYTSGTISAMVYGANHVGTRG